MKSTVNTALSFGERVAIPQSRESWVRGHDPYGLTRSLANHFGYGASRAEDLASIDSVMRQSALNRIAAFGPARSFPVGIAPRSLRSAGASGETHNRINPAGALVRNNGHSPRTQAPKSLAYHLDLLSILGTSPRQALRGLLGQPGDPNAASLGYLTFSGNR